MADQIILLAKSDEEYAQNIFDEFQERTGLDATEIDGGVAFAIDGEEHAIPVTQTLTDIDPDWPEHIELGDPSGTEGLWPAACGSPGP